MLQKVHQMYCNVDHGVSRSYVTSVYQGALGEAYLGSLGRLFFERWLLSKLSAPAWAHVVRGRQGRARRGAQPVLSERPAACMARSFTSNYKAMCLALCTLRMSNREGGCLAAR